MVGYKLYENLIYPIRQNEIFPCCSCIHTNTWIHYLDTNKTHGEKARWELHKNSASCLEQILGAALYKTATVWLLTSHLKTYSKTFEYNKWPSNEALYNSGFNEEFEFLYVNEINTYEDYNTPRNNYRMGTSTIIILEIMFIKIKIDIGK